MIEEECPICLLDYEESSLKKLEYIKLNCNHIFHIKCINNIYDKSCPICRRNFNINGKLLLLKFKLYPRFDPTSYKIRQNILKKIFSKK